GPIASGADLDVITFVMIFLSRYRKFKFILTPRNQILQFFLHLISRSIFSKMKQKTQITD
ncbi:hypothetical protein, partial [Photobacterium angustum]|uniref:hypothetical protein n=1 Tax=Photobacterium angustum TaxID=661 RepID=UPI0005E2B7D1